MPASHHKHLQPWQVSGAAAHLQESQHQVEQRLPICGGLGLRAHLHQGGQLAVEPQAQICIHVVHARQHELQPGGGRCIDVLLHGMHAAYMCVSMHICTVQHPGGGYSNAQTNALKIKESIEHTLQSLILGHQRSLFKHVGIEMNIDPNCKANAPQPSTPRHVLALSPAHTEHCRTPSPIALLHCSAMLAADSLQTHAKLCRRCHASSPGFPARCCILHEQRWLCQGQAALHWPTAACAYPRQ